MEVEPLEKALVGAALSRAEQGQHQVAQQPVGHHEAGAAAPVGGYQPQLLAHREKQLVAVLAIGLTVEGGLARRHPLGIGPQFLRAEGLVDEPLDDLEVSLGG